MSWWKKLCNWFTSNFYVDVLELSLCLSFIDSVFKVQFVGKAVVCVFGRLDININL